MNHRVSARFGAVGIIGKPKTFPEIKVKNIIRMPINRKGLVGIHDVGGAIARSDETRIDSNRYNSDHDKAVYVVSV